MLASLVLVASVLTVLVALGRGRADRADQADRAEGPVLWTLARDAVEGAAVLARLVERGRR